ARKPSEQYIGITVVSQSKLFELDADAFKPPVHILRVFYRAWRPEAFCDSCRSRPNSRIYRLGTDVFAPHTGFAAQHQARVTRFQAAVLGNRIYGVMSCRAQHMVEVVPVRQDALISLLRSLDQRLLTAPRLHHDVARQVQLKDLVPADHLLAMLFQDRKQSLIEVSLKRLRSPYTLLLHELFDLFVAGPVLSVVLISAYVHIRIRKERGNFAPEFVQHFVDVIARRIQGRVEHAPATLNVIGTGLAAKLGMTYKPRGYVAGHVKLGHDPNPSVSGVIDHVSNLLLAVEQAIRAHLLELGKPFALNTESLILAEVPVQNIQLHRRHAVDVSLDHLNRLKMPATVDK